MIVRELRDWAFPNGWQRGRDWPRLKAVLMGARDYNMVIPRPGGDLLQWFPFALRGLPYGDNVRLDAEVMLEIAVPPGTENGPLIDLPAMDALSVDSAPKWRAYIAAQSLAWIPGATQVEHPQSGRWVWTGGESCYPIITKAERRRRAFGP